MPEGFLSGLPQSFGTVYGNDHSLNSMYMRSLLLPRQSTNSSLDNRVPPMAGASQVPDLKGIHRERHNVAEKIKIMNEQDARLVPHLATNNPSPTITPIPEDIQRGAYKRGISSCPIDYPNRYRGDTSIEQKFKDLDALIDAINTSINAPITVDALIRAFLAALRRLTRSWFRKLSLRIINSFGNLSRFFIANSLSYRVKQKNASHLFTVHQKDGKSLKDYVRQFNQAILEVEDPSNKVIVMAIMDGLCLGPLFHSLTKNVPKNLSALQDKVDNDA
ncbi:hypothetical protein Acr_25g0001860 [Actinidia rufa]|uniref:Retrotransposon gag domain-containing protein n=1 Tax=Actinidia rufa TaxID=165716 RepID=A0A7J0GY70_9ERIC|nr:hypothetical protein Acr_25g0001860 [Actinidia rufa]